MFSGVSYGLHSVELVYHSTSPFFFTTASRVRSDADTEVNFGIGLSSARLFGSVRSDAGIGLPGVEISVSKGPQHFNAQTDAEGKFRVEGLSRGEYEVKLDADSVPPGYLLEDLETQRTTVDASAPAQIAFTLKAIRNISGRVTIYDRASHQEIPVPGITVLLRELSRMSVTDEKGVYLFRDLAAGPIAWSSSFKGKNPGGRLFSRRSHPSLKTLRSTWERNSQLRRSGPASPHVNCVAGQAPEFRATGRCARMGEALALLHKILLAKPFSNINIVFSYPERVPS